ncbi:hypothetical protein L9G16_23895, partial [Shewanella sp. A25]|nr:hypothetical protein [Shewanella shenzhenensis]
VSAFCFVLCVIFFMNWDDESWGVECVVDVSELVLVLYAFVEFNMGYVIEWWSCKENGWVYSMVFGVF